MNKLLILITITLLFSCNREIKKETEVEQKDYHSLFYDNLFNFCEGPLPRCDGKVKIKFEKTGVMRYYNTDSQGQYLAGASTWKLDRDFLYIFDDIVRDPIKFNIVEGTDAYYLITKDEEFRLEKLSTYADRYSVALAKNELNK